MFQTDRLRFELYNETSREELYRLLCLNQKVMSTALSGKLLSDKEFENLISKEFCESFDKPIGFMRIVEKESDRTIGVTGVLTCNYLGVQDFEFGFILEDQFWGKGYATEIGHFWINFILDELNSSRIIATTNPDNKASNSVLKN